MAYSLNPELFLARYGCYATTHLMTDLAVDVCTMTARSVDYVPSKLFTAGLISMKFNLRVI